MNKNVLFFCIGPYLLLLLGCQSTPSNDVSTQPKITITEPTSVYKKPEGLSANSAYQKIKSFGDADFETVLLPYVQSLNEINTFTEDEICAPEKLPVYENMISLNPSSVLVKSIYLDCLSDTLSPEQFQSELDEITDLAAVILSSGTGDSIATAIHTREVLELYTILELAGLNVLDVEVEFHNNQLYYKLHCLDTDTGKFHYKYANSIVFFSSYFSGALNKNLSPQKVSDLILKSLVQGNSGSLNPLVLRLIAYEGKFETIANEERLFHSDSALGQIVMAQIALYLNNDEYLNEHIDTIVTYSEMGLISANNFIAHFLFIKNGTSAIADIEQQFHEIDKASNPGHGVHLFLDSLSLRPDYEEQLTRFIELTNTRYLNDIFAYAQFLKEIKKYHYIDLSEIAEKTLNVLSNYEHAEAKYQTAESLFNNKDASEQDLSKARTLLIAAADAGFEEAQLILGINYIRAENGFEENYQLAHHYYSLAAAQGNKYALQNLASMYTYGSLGEPDISKAISYYQKAIEVGYFSAFCSLGDLYKDEVSPPQYEAARKAYQQGLKQLADQKDITDCMAGLAIVHRDHDEDYLKTREVLLRASELGSGYAAHELGILFEFEEYHMLDIAKAISFYKLAIERDYLASTANLGFIFERGADGIPIDYASALHYYQLGADAGVPQAINNLGALYFSGIEVEKDFDKAIVLYKQAADLGNAQAADNLGNIYSSDDIVTRDTIQACDYYQQAYDMQYTGSYFNYARCYFYGRGRHYDINKAIQILEEGIALGRNTLLPLLGEILIWNEQYDIAEQQLEKARSLGLTNSLNLLAKLHKIQGNYQKASIYYKEASEAEGDFSKEILLMQWRAAETDSEKYNVIEQLKDLAVEKGRNPSTFLGDIFYFGQLGEPMYEQSFHYYSQIETPDARVINIFGEMYRNGYHVEQDLAKAVEYYYLAAEQNDQAALFNLGEFYRDGIFFEPDIAKAGEYFLESAEVGLLNAKIELSKLYLTSQIPEPTEKGAEYWLRQVVERTNLGYPLLSEALLKSTNAELRDEGIYWLNRGLQARVKGSEELIAKYNIAKEQLRHD